ncbi:MAG: OmpA family protein, partial [Bacteroidota bacterium]
TLEPSLRFSPFHSDFYLYLGPRLAFNLSKSFEYRQGVNPDVPGQVANPEIKGNLSHINPLQLSMQVGAGYDIRLSSKEKRTQFVLSPFISFQPYFGQSPRSIESLNVTTLRAGVALKLGRGHKTAVPATPAAIVPEPVVKFSVDAPMNIPAERTVREVFPLRNYVFFDLGSTEIPQRYVLLTKGQIKDFREEQVSLITPENLSGRSKRQMVVYYNILNILGDRMGKDPTTTIRLVGSSEKGPGDGRAMAESIKHYLVDVFGIDPSRIITEGRNKPAIPSEQPGGTNELVMLREGDRRVSIGSSSPGLLMEFQSGPAAPLRPVEILLVQEEPIESYVSFKVEGGPKAFSSWMLEITDEKGHVQYSGPYTHEMVSMPGKTILGTRPEGNYKVTMTGTTRSGNIIKKETTAHMVLWTPPKNEEVMRFSVIYEFNESKAINLYKKYLTGIVLPKIPRNGTVIIHGYTDIIGEEVYNQKLSEARANDVRKIMEDGLAKTGRSDVKFELYGFGEDTKLAPFENKFPEERFYNRTVIIDIIPSSKR